MELTVMNKRRYDELVGKITNVETEIALAHTQLKAIQDSNNQLAEIAFDENRFTQQLLDKVDDVAQEAAKDAIDIDDIAREVLDSLDISEDVERAVSNMDLTTEDNVNDLISDYISDNSIMDSDDVDSAIDDYLQSNNYVERSDVEDIVREAVAELKDELMQEVLQLIANKLTGKDTYHANNDRDTSVQVSGIDRHSEARSYNASGA